MSWSAAAVIAIAGVVVALAALAVAVVLLLRLRGLRSAQQTLISGGSADLVDFAVSLQGRIDGVNRNVDGLVDGTVSRVAVVRYDAYENTGGHQSASVALLDASRTGVVLSAIQGRDYARIYVKELDEGR